jgi:hypothetical protein
MANDPRNSQAKNLLRASTKSKDCSMGDILTFADDRLPRLRRMLAQIEDPAARKIVIMAKRQRGELTDEETERLIRDGGLADA